MREHTCHARGCNVPVPPRLLMCRVHWRMVPKPLRDEVWMTYRPGQEITKEPTPEYLDAMQAAIEAVAQKEVVGNR
jgi:hypothetical protein